MIAIIQPPSPTFTAVRYNTEKVDQGQAELLLTANLEALGALSRIRAEDYVNYLEAHSSASVKTKLPEFHAIISCKGESHGKDELADIAVKWIKKMGYENQPYMLFFHKDSQNNHVHLVSTRVQRSGMRMDRDFEKIKGYEALNEVMGRQEQKRAERTIQELLGYSFYHAEDFAHALRAQGYFLRRTPDSYLVFQYCSKRAEIPLELLIAKSAQYQNDQQALQKLKDIIVQCKKVADPMPRPVKINLAGGRQSTTPRMSSPLAELLLREYGLQLLYHGGTVKSSAGYTLVDPHNRIIYSGGDLVPITEVTMRCSDRPDPIQPERQLPDGAPSEILDIDLLQIDIANDQDDEATVRRKARIGKRKNKR